MLIHLVAFPMQDLAVGFIPVKPDIDPQVAERTTPCSYAPRSRMLR